MTVATTSSAIASTNGMRTIVMSFALGRYSRVFTQPGVTDLLASHPDTRLLVLSPAAHLGAFRNLFGLHENIGFENLPDYEPMRTLPLRALWKLLDASQGRGVIFLPLMRLYELMSAKQEPRLFDEMFLRHTPSLVVTASPGFNSARDIPLIREAQRRGIPTLCVVYQWDNLRIKGFMPTRPDTLAVWNELMKQEATDLHHYDPSAIRVVGPPQFDLYQNRDVFLPREQFFQQLGLDPSKRMILFATGTLRRSDNAFILDILERAIQSGALVKPCQVLCRLHPTRKKNRSDQNVVARGAGSPHVKFDSTFGYVERVGWTPDRDEAVHIANLVYHADIVVNIVSTITVDAAILDRPIINVGFNPVEPERFEQMVIKWLFRKHFHHVLETRATSVVKSEGEFIRSVNEYLVNPALRRAERRILAEDICYRLDGKASRRVADVILELAGV